MAIAKNNHFWTARLGGNDPASPVGYWLLIMEVIE